MFKLEIYLIFINLCLYLKVDSKIEFCKNCDCKVDLECVDQNNLNRRPLFDVSCCKNDTIINQIDLTNEDFLNLENIQNLTDNKIVDMSDNLKIQMTHVNRFFAHKGIVLLNSTILLSLRLSKFKFYNQNISELNKAECVIENFDKFLIFKSIRSLETELNVEFSQKICPLIMVNSDLNLIKVKRLVDSYISRNRLAFHKVDSDLNELEVKSKITSFYITLYEYDLNKEIINDLVFSNLNTLKIKGTVKNMDKNLFSSINSIKKLTFFLANLRDFFHSGTEWFESLNNNFKGNFSINDLSLFENELMSVYFLWDIVTSLDIYDFPDEDFCLFYKFPIERFIFPFVKQRDRSDIYLKQNQNCSCTVIWLLRYYRKFENFSNQYLSYENYYDTLVYKIFNSYFSEYDGAIRVFGYKLYDNSDLCDNYNASQNYLKCNFTKRLAECQNLQDSSYNNQINLFKLNENLLIARYVTSIFLFQFFSIFGLIVNYICYLVISKKKFTESMYKYMKLNSVFNSLYCFLMSFRLVNECLGSSSLFCPELYNLEIIQYFKIYIILYLGNVVKLLSNITFVSISLTRFIKITSVKTKFNFLNTISTRKYTVLIIVFSLLFNLNIIFNYKINLYEPHNFYPIYETKSNFYDGNIESKHVLNTAHLVYNVYNFIETFFVYFVFIIPNLVIDMYLYKFLNKSNKKGKSLVKQQNTETIENKDSKCFTLIRDAFINRTKSNKLTNQEKKKSSERKIMYMILLNGLDFLILRLPEMFAIILNYYLHHNYGVNTTIKLKTDHLPVLCFYSPFSLCETLLDIVEIFFVVSLIFQVFIYFYFNNNIKQAFYDYFKIKKNVLK